MKNQTIILLFGLLAFTFTACTDDNFLVQNEIPDDYTPTVVEKEDNYLNFRQNTQEIHSGEGFARFEEESNIDFVLVSADSIICNARGGFKTSVDRYVLSFMTSDKNPENFQLLTGLISQDTSYIPWFAGLSYANCSDVPDEINITEYSDTLFAGVVEANYYLLDTAFNTTNQNNICERHFDRGRIRIEFSVPLESCN